MLIISIILALVLGSVLASFMTKETETCRNCYERSSIPEHAETVSALYKKTA